MLRVASLESEAIASRRVQDAGSWLFASLRSGGVERIGVKGRVRMEEAKISVASPEELPVALHSRPLQTPSGPDGTEGGAR